MRILSALIIGLIFGLGISISGMANPAKVLNFFDIFGTWDPSLAFVMAGALAVNIPGYRLAFRRPAPVIEPTFQIPDKRVIDRRLVLGSATFGIGWGIAGFCPGGALPVISTLEPGVLVFIAALIVGMLVARLPSTWFPSRGKS